MEDNQQYGLPSVVRTSGSGHHDIPPKAHTRPSDVEAIQRLQEAEFFDRESFRCPAGFRARVTTYRRYFNIARANRNKEWKTPLQIRRERNPTLDLAIASWRPLDLGAELRQHFPSYHAQTA